MSCLSLSRRALALLILVLAGSPPEVAAAPDVRLRDYVHTNWTHHDGVPLGMINRILQTSDGYLWVLTREEFLRFDGMRFVPGQTPCTKRVTHIARAGDGGFWAICGEMLFWRTAAGRFVVSPQIVSQPNTIALAVDGGGRVWLLGRTIRYLEPDGIGGKELANPPGASGLVATMDSEGAMWGWDRRNVFRLYPDRIELVTKLTFNCAIAARTGGLIVASGNRIQHLHADGRVSPVADLAVDDARHCMGEAADGGLWVGTRRNGLARVQGGRVELLGDTANFDRQVLDVISDREGAIWVASATGLHRFRKPTVQIRRLSREQGQPWFVFVDSRNYLWTGSSTNLRYRRVDHDTEHSVTPDTDYVAIGEDQQGTLWLSNGEAIGRVANGTFVPVADVNGKPIARVYSFKRDPEGQLWAVGLEAGVYQVSPGPPRLMFPSTDAAVRFLPSKDSGMWIGVLGGGLEQHVNGRTTRFPRRHPGPPDPSPRTVIQDGDSLWVGSLGGLDRLRNGTWTTWTSEHGLPADGAVKEMTADRSGFFWLMTRGGLVRLSRAQLDATPDGRPQPLSFARIGLLDGVVPHPGNMSPSPAVTSDRAGRLYFTLQDAVAVVDPATVSDSSMTPPIVLESVIVDNEPVDRENVNRFVEPSKLQFEFTSLSLDRPELARFRYRLDGHDPEWKEGGGQRQVTYGTLRPGQYQFQVIGAGAEGVWNEVGVSFSFQILPVFWRTWWFQWSALAVGLSISAGLYQLRIHQLTRQFNAGLEARVGERIRIARELHDTLLQTFQGVVIHFQAATNLLPGRPDEARRKFERALEQAGQAITEGRDAVQAMRESAGASGDLPRALSDVAEQQLAEGTHNAPKILVNVEGASRRLHPIVRDDVYRIAAEAIRNAARHAEARTIQVDVHYDHRCLRLRIRDDGKGIGAAVLEGRGSVGHWGLPGMRERAELIGGTLDVRSRIGAGTEVELGLPASKAYAETAGRRRFWRRSRYTETSS
jgi:signal transduction histidine kinase/ligand-binding sensor domain-containing protein